FERLKPTAVVPPAGTAPLGALGRVALGTRVEAASLFKDFDGGANGVGAANASSEPAEAAAEPIRTEAENAADAAYADGFDAGKAAAVAELVRDGETFAKALQELARFRASLLERYQGELLALALGIAR